jgi:hypothetical protein
MKKKLMMLAGCAAVAMAAEIATVRLPFAAQVGATLLPAGEYRVGTVDNRASTSVITLVDDEGHRATVPAKRILREGPGAAELKFTRSGNGLKLRQIFVEGRAYSYELEP